MKCPKCGAPLDEDSKFCVVCGAHLEEADTVLPADAEPAAAPAEPVEEPSAVPAASAEPAPAAAAKPAVQNILQKDLLKWIEIAVGAVFIIVGLIRIFGAGTSISSTSFGGDFYTYTYRGIVAITELLSAIEVTLGWILTALGAFIGLHGLRR